MATARTRTAARWRTMPLPTPRRSTWQKFSPLSAPVFSNLHRLTGNGVAHAHDFVEVAIIAGGRCTHVSQSGEVEAALGDVFVLRPGSWHWYVGCEDLLLANCCMAADALRTEFALFRSISGIHELLWTAPMRDGHGVSATRIPVTEAARALREVRRLREHLATPDPSHAVTVGRLLTVFGILASSDTATAGSSTAADAAAIVAHAVETDPQRAWSLNDLAALANLAPTYLSAVFRAHMGLPPLAFVTRVRVERAATLLSQTDLSVAEVGGAVGWADPSYFARRFHRFSGLSPRDYRRQVRNGGAVAPPAQP